MNNKYTFFKYVFNDSKIHTMNSKTKISIIFLLLISSILLVDYVSLICLLLFLIYLSYKSKISYINYLKNEFIVWPFYLFVFIISLVLSYDISISLICVLKFILIIKTLLILTATTSLSEIAWGIEGVLKPLKKIKISVSNFSLKIALGIKLISTLFDQTKEVRKSMAYRGLPYNNNPISTFKKIFVPALTLSIKHILNVKTAMKLKFYGSTKKRTNYREFKKTKFDNILFIISLILLYLTIYFGFVNKNYLLIDILKGYLYAI